MTLSIGGELKSDFADAVSDRSSLDTIAALAAIGQELGAEAIERDARQLAERIENGLFYVACIGQFKRGKSTLMNALIGAPIIPTGILPVTAVPTVIRFAPKPTARVETDADGWREIAIAELTDYVSEDRNPENHRGVRAVEVGYPSAVLANGLCLVDTPGIGSVFLGNTATTQDFIPHIDAAIVVIGVDPPLGQEELVLIAEVARRVNDIVVVMNKADRFTELERRDASAFAERMLERELGRSVGPVVQVSATDQLANAMGLRDWDDLVQRLDRLGKEGGRDMVRDAAARGIRRLVLAAIAETDAQRSTLLRPISDSERRLDALRQTLNDAAQRALELRYLFTAEEDRLTRTFEERREKFLRETLPVASAEFAEVLSRLSALRGPRFRTLARQEARRIGRARIDPWLEEERVESERQYLAVAARFIGLANDFLAQLAEADAEEFSRLGGHFEFDSALRVESRYYFHRLDPLLYGNAWQSALDWVRSRRARRDAVSSQMMPYLSELVTINSTRVAVDVRERVVESRRRLEAEIQGALSDVYLAAERGVAKARRIQFDGQRAVRAEVERLGDLRMRLQDRLV